MRQVHLGDMPAKRSARRLADGVWRATLPRLAAFGAAAAAAAAATALHALPGAASLPDNAYRLHRWNSMPVRGICNAPAPCMRLSLTRCKNRLCCSF